MFIPTAPFEFILIVFAIILAFVFAVIISVSFILVLRNWLMPFFFWLDEKTKLKDY